MPRHKPRRLWLQLRYGPEITASKRTIIETLLESIKRGDYEYPKSWRIALGWSNKENGALKWGEWTKEMTRSAKSSEGFDFAVRSYLENLL